MTEEEVLELVSSLGGVAVLTASEEGGAPDIAWGDSFFYYVAPGQEPSYQQQPFATVVVTDYPGFDVESRLDRTGVFRVNIAVGRSGYHRLLGHRAAEHKERHSDYDYACADVLLPHPVYAEQGWVSVVNPGPRTADLVRELLTGARELAARRDRRRQRSATTS